MHFSDPRNRPTRQPADHAQELPCHPPTRHPEQDAVRQVPAVRCRSSSPTARGPNVVIDKAPLWCSVDLRDGNQALIDPMDPTRKLRMFDELVRMGFKEIEVGFPAASQPDFDFIRQLIEEDLIPDDVHDPGAHAVPAGADRAHVRVHRRAHRKAIVHFYNSTNPLQREVVFGLDKAGIIDIAVNAAKLCRKLEETMGSARWSATSTRRRASRSPSPTSRSRSARR